MCVVSMIGDHYRDKWTDPWPWKTIPNPIAPYNPPYNPSIPQVPYTAPITITLPPEVSKAEFEALKKEVLEMKDLLKRAKEYDAKNGEPDCEMDEKVALLKRVAALVGVDLSEIFGKGVAKKARRPKNASKSPPR